METAETVSGAESQCHMSQDSRTKRTSQSSCRLLLWEERGEGEREGGEGERERKEGRRGRKRDLDLCFPILALLVAYQ